MRLFIVLFISFITITSVNAQIKGNGNRTSVTRSFDKIDKVSIDINGKVKIICNSDETKVEIKHDENILDYVATKMKNGTLSLDQKEWISGTEEVEIIIYTKVLNVLENDSWSNIEVSNIQQENLKVNSSISDISLAGKVQYLEIQSKDSDINARQLDVENVDIHITQNGSVYLDEISTIKANCKEDCTISYKGEPKGKSGNYFENDIAVKNTKSDTRFIKVKFKNNSLSRINCYVKGPKPNGKYFSYGLSFFPMSTKNEVWSIGTKLYKVGLLGNKTLIYTVTEEDEGKLVKLF